MNEPVKYNEEQAIARLEMEPWRRQGESLITQHSFDPDAVTQCLTPLAQAKRDALRLRVTESDTHAGAKKFVMNARAAEKFFADRGTTLKLSEPQVQHRR